MADDKPKSSVVAFAMIRPTGLYNGVGSHYDSKREETRVSQLSTASVSRFSRLENEIDSLLEQGHLEENPNSRASNLIKLYLGQAIDDLQALYREMQQPYVQTGDPFPPDLKEKFEKIMTHCSEFMPEHFEVWQDQETDIITLDTSMSHD